MQGHRGDLAGRLAATLKKSLKGRACIGRSIDGILVHRSKRLRLASRLGRVHARKNRADQGACSMTEEIQPRLFPRRCFPRNPPRAWRHAALAIRRDVRSALPDARLRLRQRRAGGSPLSRHQPRLSIQPLRQSDRRHARRAPAPDGRRRGCARHGHRHGGRHDDDSVQAQCRRSYRRRPRHVRLVPLHRRSACVRASASSSR